MYWYEASSHLPTEAGKLCSKSDIYGKYRLYVPFLMCHVTSVKLEITWTELYEYMLALQIHRG